MQSLKSNSGRVVTVLFYLFSFFTLKVGIREEKCIRDKKNIQKDKNKDNKDIFGFWNLWRKNFLSNISYIATY